VSALSDDCKRFAKKFKVFVRLFRTFAEVARVRSLGERAALSRLLVPGDSVQLLARNVNGAS